MIQKVLQSLSEIGAMDTFGEWLRSQRTARKLTREEFAQRVGCSIVMLRKIEEGERRPSAQIAQLIANVLEIPADNRKTFIRVARGELGTERLPHPSNAIHSPRISPIPGSSHNNLPILPTPLIGRQHELSKLRQLLSEPECRMLTLVGPGGIGKTRLAIDVAAQVLDMFTDGVYFVPLAPVSSPRYIVPVIADSIGFAFQSVSSIEPKIQLLNYLEGKKILLLVDNVEHLLQEAGVEFLGELLSYVSQLKLLVTSREPVNLQGEWVLEVEGLPLPEAQNLEGTSVELFLQRARRAYVGFTVAPNDYPSILRVCQLVNGMPLGIELAAAWVRTLSCQQIAREIEQSLDFLSTSARDLPSRHRSMRAVFDHSWKLLSAEEQSVLSQLSIFQGGFAREAAEQIAGAQLFSLSSLVTKSLIRRSGETRYDLHELIRQYAADRLAEHRQIRKKVQERHARYYMNYVCDRDVDLRGSSQQEVIAELSVEMDNFRAAWNWCIDHGEFNLIEQTLRTLETFFDARGWLHEGLDYLDRALATLEKSDKKFPLVHGHLLAAQSLLLFRLAQIELARVKLEQSIEILRPLNQPHVLVEAVSFLGIVNAIIGRYPEALQLFHQGLALAQASGDTWFEALSLTEIINIEILAGNAEHVYERLQSAVNAWRATGDPRFIAFGLNTMSLSAVRIRRFEEARAAIEESIMINRSVGDRWGLGSAYRGLGLLEQEQGRHAEALAAFQQSWSVFADLGARWEEARVLSDMGRSLLAQGGSAQAEKVWRESIQLAVASQGVPLILDALTGIAQIRIKEAKIDEAYAYVLHILTHPVTTQETRSRADGLRAELESQLTLQEVESLQTQKNAAEFDAILKGILNAV